MVAFRPLILCMSVHHGNTATVARAIAAVLDAEIVSPEEASCPTLANIPVVGFGSGVYYGRMHDALRDWLSDLPDAAVPTVPAFLFSTAGLPWLSWLWHRPMRRLVATRAFASWASFAVAATTPGAPSGSPAV